MQLLNKIGNFFNNLKTDTMAKKLFKSKPHDNPTKVKENFDALRTFIDESSELTETEKTAMHGVINGHAAQTNMELKNQSINVAHLNSAIGKVNRFIEQKPEQE